MWDVREEPFYFEQVLGISYNDTYTYGHRVHGNRVYVSVG